MSFTIAQIGESEEMVSKKGPENKSGAGDNEKIQAREKSSGKGRRQ